MRRYTLLLTPATEEGGYVVTVPALEGCITEGDSIEEAIRNAREAIQGYIESLEEAGEEIPEESLPPQLITIDVQLPSRAGA